ncbi:hypothetical protein R6Q57_023861 [Mikania cordata]
MATVSVPYSHVDCSLRALAGQAEGFGRLAVGGLNGAIYHVTTLSEFEGGRGHDVDGIQIKPNSKHIWIDRCSLKDYDDGLIDITRQSTNITISRCHFSNHDKTMLIGADASHHGDRCMCVYSPLMGPDNGILVLGMPECICITTTPETGAFMLSVPVLNHRYIHNATYTKQDRRKWLSSISPRSISPILAKTILAPDKEEASSGCIISHGDLFMSGTQPGLLEPTAISGGLFHPSQHYQTWTVVPATKELKNLLQHCTGWQDVPCPPGT